LQQQAGVRGVGGATMPARSSSLKKKKKKKKKKTQTNNTKASTARGGRTGRGLAAASSFNGGAMATKEKDSIPEIFRAPEKVAARAIALPLRGEDHRQFNTGHLAGQMDDDDLRSLSAALTPDERRRIENRRKLERRFYRR
jgi:hypothetical protein